MITGTCHCGAVHWTFAETPKTATMCNCTICRRYGVMWAYDYDGEGIQLSGPTQVYIRGDKEIGFHFCATCGCILWWRGLEPDKKGRHRTAVNLRMAEIAQIAEIPIRHFDGLDTWSDQPLDGRHVRDMWF